MKSQMFGILAAIVSAMALSSMGILGKLAFEEGMHPINLVVLRALIASSFLGIGLILLRRRVPRIGYQHLPLFLVLGVVGIGLNYASFFLALENTTVSVAISLLYTYPIFVAIGAAIFLGEAFTPVKGVVLGITLIGCIQITGAYDVSLLKLNFWGIFFGFSASLTKTVYTLLGKRLVGVYDPWDTVFYAFSFGAVFLVIIAVSTSDLSFSISAQSWLYVISIAVVPTLLGYSLFVVSLKYLESGRASIIATLEPVLAVLLATFLLGEAVSAPQVIGMLLVVSGIILLNVANMKRSQISNVI